MSIHRSAHGFTVLEVLIAMAVITLGALGTASLVQTGLRLNDNARQVTRASLIAQDLMAQIQLWPYGDTRLADGETLGVDPTDEALRFEREDAPAADYSDEDLAADFDGIPTAALEGRYQRFWNVAHLDDSNGNGVWDGVRIAVIVRWPSGGRWRRVVLNGFKPNTVE